MKKLPLFIVLIAYFAAHFTHAQHPTDQRNWMFELFTSPYHGGYEGNSNFLSFGSVKTSYNSSGYFQNTNSRQFHLSPKIAYLLFDHLATGIALEYHSSNTHYDLKYDQKVKSVWAGPFVRYYFLDLEKIYPFMEAGYQAGGTYVKRIIDKSTDKYSGSNQAFYGTIGVGYPVTEHFLMNLSLNNSFVRSNSPYDDSSADYTSLFWQVGFTIAL